MSSSRSRRQLMANAPTKYWVSILKLPTLNLKHLVAVCVGGEKGGGGSRKQGRFDFELFGKGNSASKREAQRHTCGTHLWNWWQFQEVVYFPPPCPPKKELKIIRRRLEPSMAAPGRPWPPKASRVSAPGCPIYKDSLGFGSKAPPRGSNL